MAYIPETVPEARASNIDWSNSEAFACALSWAGFPHPEIRAGGSPETHWLTITPEERQRYRELVRKLQFIPIIHKQAVPISPSWAWRDDHLMLVGANAKIKNKKRIRDIIDAVWHAARSVQG